MKLYMAGMVPFLISKELYRSEALQKVHKELDKKDDLAYESLESGAIDLPMYRRQCEKNKAERERISACSLFANIQSHIRLAVQAALVITVLS